MINKTFLDARIKSLFTFLYNKLQEQDFFEMMV
jgi:hypothetical protein